MNSLPGAPPRTPEPGPGDNSGPRRVSWGIAIFLGSIAVVIGALVGAFLIAAEDDVREGVETAAAEAGGSGPPLAAMPPDLDLPEPEPFDINEVLRDPPTVGDEYVLEQDVNRFGEPGTCLSPDTGLIIHCAQPHVSEILGVIPLEAGLYPGADVVGVAGLKACTRYWSTVRPLVGRPTGYHVNAWQPTLHAWSTGDKDVVCELFTYGDPVTGSVLAQTVEPAGEEPA